MPNDSCDREIFALTSVLPVELPGEAVDPSTIRQSAKVSLEFDPSGQVDRINSGRRQRGQITRRYRQDVGVLEDGSDGVMLGHHYSNSPLLHRLITIADIP